MTHRITVQNPYHYSDIPTLTLIRRWAKKALTVTERPLFLKDRAQNDALLTPLLDCFVANAPRNDAVKKDIELCIRIVDENESAELNQRFRNKLGPTNILSFPSPFDIHQNPIYLGDIAICAPLVNKEADDQEKDLTFHWAHLIIHGVLHLMEFDHETTEQATQMEALEIMLLKTLGYDNPYGGD